MSNKKSNFVISEAEESDQEEDLEPHERVRLKKLKAIEDSSEEEEEDDETEAQEILKDLIDDREIEDEDSDGSASVGKRKKSDEEDEDDDRLEDDDYDLLEENLGVKVQRRKRFKRVRPQLDDDESDGEDQNDNGDLQRERIAERIFDSEDEAPMPPADNQRRQQMEEERSTARDNYDDDEEDDSEDDGFIVDDDGVPITSKRKQKKHKFADASLQEGQDVFGVDFDYDEFEKYDEDEYEDEYEVDGGDTEKRPKKLAKKKSAKKSIFEIYEPSELKRGHFTDVDIEIRKRDMPERMQLREVPVTAVPEGSAELEDEAEWIYKQAFCKESVSSQEMVAGATGSGAEARAGQRKPPTTINKIRQALDFMRNQQLEVPFIAFYRKEYVQPELNISDLWKVYRYDGKWCQLLSRKRALMLLFEKMQAFQEEKFVESPEAQVPDDCRLIQDEDVERLKSVQTPEELKDVHQHFLLHYSHEFPAMNEAWRKRERVRKSKARREARDRLQVESAGDDPEKLAELEAAAALEDEEEDAAAALDDAPPEDQLKQAVDTGPYAICRKAGILGMAKKFGLTPEQFAENLRDNYQRHEVDQEPTEPVELARQYLGVRFGKAEDVLEACKFVVARQIAQEPLLRKSVREIYFERARLSVRPTKQGEKEIDENHACYGMKYLKNKPVRDFVGDQFLRLHMAEEDKLLEITLHERLDGMSSGSSYLDEVKSLYQRDEFAKNVQDWNELRAQCVEIALTKRVLPDLRKELRSILLNEAKDYVMRACCRKLSNWIKVAPYSANFPDEDDYEWDASKGIRVMGVAYVPDPSQAAFCALISGEGEVTDYLRVPNILRRRPRPTEGEQNKASKGDSDLMAIKDFIRNKKPHVIALGGESREAMQIQQNIRDVIKELVKEEHFPEISVEIVDNELAKIYSNSNKGNADFREYPTLLRQAISCARKLQDPLVEFSQLCTADEEILCLRYNTLQDQLVKEELLENLYLEFINRTNEIGVDVNLAVQNALFVNLVQFVCGLGPRKGAALIKLLKQTNQRLENRTQLVTACHMGPKVFINCSGFIRIDTNSLGDSTEAYVEVLDGSRVHPETYEWARKMAIDALEYDDEQMNPAGALDEILESPERLKDLDLDAFAVELERQGFGNKSITLYDIRAELNHRYKDLRRPYRSPTSEELFDWLTKETPETFYVGKMVLATVTGFTYKRPQPEQLDQANPVKNDETGLWQCPFCMKTDFPELSEVWNHFDAKSCPGQATGVRLALDNDLSGFIHIKNLSDKHVKNPEERVQKQQTIHVRVTKIDVERFSVDCTSKSSDLMDKNHEWRPTKDQYYDQEAEDAERRKEEEGKKVKARQHYVKRVIVHPAFHNKSYTEALKVMEAMDQGEVIVRPSSKGPTHLTVTWKVADGIYQHIDVREEGKENEFSLGKSLWIGNEEFEDLDEIIARHVNPMAGYARDLLTYKYYKETGGGVREKADEMLKEDKKKNANKIHYIFSVAKNYPGKFLLSYLPKARVRHEYVTITPDGFRYRQQVFDNINGLLKWFKEHFRDPMPVANTPVQTPRQQQHASARPSPYGTTPGQMSQSNSMSSADAIAKVAQNMPSQLLHSLSQVTSHQTPHYTHTPGGASSSSGYGGQSNYVNTPYTPSGQTPFMTPYTSQTPRYGQTTPSMSGPFVMPGVPMSGQGGSAGGSYGSGGGRSGNAGYHQSPQQQQQVSSSRHHHSGGGQHGSSPYVPSPQSRYGGTTSGGHGGHESNDWARANDAWARGSKSGSGGSGGIYGEGSHTPRGGSGRTPRQDDGGQKSYSTHRKPQQMGQGGGYDESMRPPSRARSDYGKSPRPGGRPSASPHHSVMMGDATPLHDEN